MRRFFAKLYKYLWVGDDFNYERAGLVFGEAGHSSNERIISAFIVGFAITATIITIGAIACTLRLTQY